MDRNLPGTRTHQDWDKTKIFGLSDQVKTKTDTSQDGDKTKTIKINFNKQTKMLHLQLFQSTAHRISNLGYFLKKNKRIIFIYVWI